MPAALRLAAEILKEASLPETEFEQIRKQQITSLEAARPEPQFQAGSRLMTALFQYPKSDVRAMLTPDERIAATRAVKYEQLVAFHKSFYGASHGELAIVGDFDSAAAKKVLSEEFGAWKSPAAYQEITTGYAAVPAINESIETPDKTNANFMAALRLNVSDQDADYPALTFGNFLLGGGFLNSRLATRIRVKDGLSYGVSSSLSARHKEKGGFFQTSAIAAPQNIAKVEAAFLEEIEKVLKDGFTAKEVEAGHTGWIQSRQVNRSSDAAIAQLLVARQSDGVTMAWDEDFEKKVMALTPEVITSALRRHLVPANISIVKAGDFKKAGASK